MLVSFSLLFLLYRNTFVFDSSIPIIVFDFYTKTHLLVPSSYHIPLSKGREKLHKVIFKLHKQSLGYKKIHKRLVEKGFKIGKSPSTVDSIIKKRMKREEFLNRPVFEEYRSFDIEFYKIKKEEF